MRIGLLKLAEEGSEEITTIEGNEQPEANDADAEYEAWFKEQEKAVEEEENEESKQFEEPEEEEAEETEYNETESQENVENDSKEEEEEEKTTEESDKWTLKTSKGEIEYDPSDTEATKAWVQKGMDAQQKWQEAAAIRNQSYKFMEALKANPREILENPALGIDLVKVAEEVLYDKLEEENMTPAERKLRDENRALKAAEKKRELEAQQAQIASQKEAQQRTHALIEETVEAAGLPVTGENIDRVYDYMKQAAEAGLSNVSPKDVIDHVKTDFISDRQNYVRNMPVDQLMEFLGKDVVDGLRKHNLEVLKAKPKAKPTPVKSSKKKEAAKPKFGDLTAWLNQ